MSRWRRVLRALAPGSFLPPMEDRELRVMTPDGPLRLVFDPNMSEQEYMRAVQWVEDMRASENKS